VILKTKLARDTAELCAYHSNLTVPPLFIENIILLIRVMEENNPHSTPSWVFVGQGDLIEIDGKRGIHRDAAVKFDAAKRLKKGHPMWKGNLTCGEAAWCGKTAKHQVRFLEWFKIYLSPVCMSLAFPLLLLLLLLLLLSLIASCVCRTAERYKPHRRRRP
jgi:hypothetical protein